MLVLLSSELFGRSRKRVTSSQWAVDRRFTRAHPSYPLAPDPPRCWQARSSPHRPIRTCGGRVYCSCRFRPDRCLSPLGRLPVRKYGVQFINTTSCFCRIIIATAFRVVLWKIRILELLSVRVSVGSTGSIVGPFLESLLM